MTNYKNVLSGQTTTSNVLGDKSTSDSVIINWSLVVAKCLSNFVHRCSSSIMHMLSKDVPIMTSVATLGQPLRVR
jgi:hypothetical protein